MYQVSNAFLEQMKSPIQEHRITGTVGSVSFSEANIVEGSFSISNQSTDTNDVVLGSCYVGQLTCEFTGIDIAWGKWINKVITPSFGLKIGDTWEEVPLGIFTVKEAKHTDHGVQVTAYDRMIKFDKKFKKANYMNMSGMWNIISQLCADSGVTLGMTRQEIEALPNGSRTGINVYGSKGKKAEFANDITTNRDLLFWVAQTLGCFATINRSGQLEFRPYTQTVVDRITNEHRLDGATFADYITHYVGIYLENLDDNTEDYYGYDTTALNEELTETQAEISADTDQITELVNELEEWDAKLERHECTQEEYDAAVAEITAELHPLELEVKQLTKRVAWIQDALQQSADDGSDLVLGANPLVMAKSRTTRDSQRREILGALVGITYTPFQASVLCGCIYDLGDVIQFSGGLYNSETDSFGCVMSYNYTHNGGTELQGFGVDPSIPQIRNKNQKSTDRADRNAIDAKEPVHIEQVDDGSVAVRDDSILRDSSDNAPGENDRVWEFRAWAQNDIIASPAKTWAKMKVEIKIDHNAIICDYPVEISGQYRTADIGGTTYTDSQVAFVVKVPKDGEKPKICEKNTFLEGNNDQSQNVYTAWDRRVQANYGAWGDWVEITYKAASVGDWDYYVAIRTVGTTYAGLYGMSYPNKHYPSSALFQSDLEAGNIDPPQLANGDVVLPKDSTKKSLQTGLQDLANYIGDKSGDAYDPATGLTEPSPIDVASDLTEQGIVRAVSQIKDGVGGLYTNIQNFGRGNIVAKFSSKDGQTVKEIKASTNLVNIEQIAPIDTNGKLGDTQFVITNEAGLIVSKESSEDYVCGEPTINASGYKISAHAKGDSSLDYGGVVIYRIDGLTPYENYTFTYSVRAYDMVNGGEENPSYYEPMYRHGVFGLLYSYTLNYDTHNLPSNNMTNDWFGDLQWQNFSNLGKTAVSYTNTITVTHSTIYLVFKLDPLIKPQDDYVYFEVSNFKTTDTVFVLSDLYARGEDNWFKFAGGGGGGTSDYNGLANKPQINSVTLSGNKTTRDLGMIQELTQAQYDALPSADKQNPDKVYYIKDAGSGGGGGGGGGSTVTITPTLSTGTKIADFEIDGVSDELYAPQGGASAISDLADVDLDNLSDGQILKWNDTTEKWENADESGGGGSYTETELFSGNASTAGNVQLSDDIGNYDEIVIWCGWSASNVNGLIPIRVSVAVFKTFVYAATPQTSTDHIFCYLYSTQYFRVARGSDDTKIYLFDNHSGAIKRVVGIKY